MNPEIRITPINACQPKLLSMATPALVRNETTRPAIMIPRPIKGKAFLNGMPKTKAIKEAVQPPVTGRGMATKIGRR
jgi:hypothetical protein